MALHAIISATLAYFLDRAALSTGYLESLEDRGIADLGSPMPKSKHLQGDKNERLPINWQKAFS